MVTTAFKKNEEAVFAAWGDVEATYQRRADLIPNLVETVKAYAAHEKETLTEITNARAKVGQVQLSADKLGDAAMLQKFQQAQGELSGALSRLLVVAERYPNLKASQNFRDLQISSKERKTALMSLVSVTTKQFRRSTVRSGPFRTT